MAWLWHSGVHHPRHAPACFDNLPEQPNTPASTCSLPKTKAATNHPPVIRRWEPANLMLNNWPTEIAEWVWMGFELFLSHCRSTRNVFILWCAKGLLLQARKYSDHFYSKTWWTLLVQPSSRFSFQGPGTQWPPIHLNWSMELIGPGEMQEKHWGYEKTLILYEKCFNNVHRIGLLSTFDSPI